ncbi:MAG: enoyl-CoA hydratase/isomerase family protein [Promethearchaeota archaeon]
MCGIGLSRAPEILYTGRFVDAKEASEIGLVSKVIKDEELFENAMELAQDLSTKSPLGLQMTKEAINYRWILPVMDTITQLENRAQILAATTKDVLEGVSAFFEKRRPKYPLK